jgi:hypothetical protein
MLAWSVQVLPKKNQKQNTEGGSDSIQHFQDNKGSSPKFSFKNYF